MPESLHFVDASTEEHFAAMSAIHCRGWRSAYPGYVPDDYLQEVTTEEHWIPFFREDYATYVEPAATGRGYGSLLLEEAVRRLKAEGYPGCTLFVLRENTGGRRFYERHGFAWDGTVQKVPFPHDMVCNDLRYVRSL